MRQTLPEPTADEQEHSARLQETIRGEIQAAGGMIPFTRYMQLALYAPGQGYYSAGASKLGAAGDFVTAPEVSPLFSRCLAHQCAQVLHALEGGGSVLEFGAGSGVMAGDLLAELEVLNVLPDRYYILEVSPDLRARQRQWLKSRAPRWFDRVRWLDDLNGLTVPGVVLANEVLDALPVQCFMMRGEGVFERCVGEVDAGFGWVEREADVKLRERVELLRLQTGPWRLPYGSEWSPWLTPWMRRVASVLQRGAMILIDYGYPRREFYLPERSMGTLICHYRHLAHEDPFSHVGVQDLSASVDFTAVAEAGAEAGLHLAGYTHQAAFLLANGLDELYQAAFDVPERERIELSRQVKLLTLPSEMGERFQVIALTKGLDFPLRGFALRDLTHRL